MDRSVKADECKAPPVSPLQVTFLRQVWPGRTGRGGMLRTL